MARKLKTFTDRISQEVLMSGGCPMGKTRLRAFEGRSGPQPDLRDSGTADLRSRNASSGNPVYHPLGFCHLFANVQSISKLRSVFPLKIFHAHTGPV